MLGESPKDLLRVQTKAFALGAAQVYIKLTVRKSLLFSEGMSDSCATHSFRFPADPKLRRSLSQLPRRLSAV